MHARGKERVWSSNAQRRGKKQREVIQERISESQSGHIEGLGRGAVPMAEVEKFAIEIEKSKTETQSMVSEWLLVQREKRKKKKK